ncbi:MAG: iron response transcriptional regulator IrrA [Bdellovibrionales bacterium]
MNSKQKKPDRKYDSLADLLQEMGLRPTKQRIGLAKWLFSGQNKHITAEQAYSAAIRMRMRVSLATIYNTLNKFTQAGLLQQTFIDGSRIYFDTNKTPHHHFYDEETQLLSDVASSVVCFSRLPKLPKGKSLSRIDVVLCVRNIRR